MADASATTEPTSGGRRAHSTTATHGVHHHNTPRNRKELALLSLGALVQQKDGGVRRTRLAIPILLALFGAGLLYGDGVITPAVSVLGAVEGLSEQDPRFADLIVPISAAILIGLFWVQRYGTHR